MQTVRFTVITRDRPIIVLRQAKRQEENETAMCTINALERLSFYFCSYCCYCLLESSFCCWIGTKWMCWSPGSTLPEYTCSFTFNRIKSPEWRPKGRVKEASSEKDIAPTNKPVTQHVTKINAFLSKMKTWAMND